jgi:two-component system response regulator MprA
MYPSADPGLSAPPRSIDEATPRRRRVLVIEDEPGIREFVQEGLENAGFQVVTASEGLEGERLALSESYDAIVLDLMLPGRTGQEILASVMDTRPHVPVIALTARARLADRVAGLEAGATDYITKPFALPELVARLRAQLRGSTRSSEAVLCGAGIEADLMSRRVRRDGRQVQLSTLEFNLLAYMLRHRGEVLNRKQILRAVWGYQHDTATNSVDVYIGYLRRKLGFSGSPAPIQTVRGVGYRLGERL